MAGAVCAQLVPVDTCQDQELVAPHTKGGHAVTHVLYILTLGADQSYRKRGIATRLLQHLAMSLRALTSTNPRPEQAAEA